MFVDVLDTSAKVYWAGIPRSGGRTGVKIGIGEHTMNQEQVHPQPDLPERALIIIDHHPVVGVLDMGGDQVTFTDRKVLST